MLLSCLQKAGLHLSAMALACVHLESVPLLSSPGALLHLSAFAFMYVSLSAAHSLGLLDELHHLFVIASSSVLTLDRSFFCSQRP